MAPSITQLNAIEVRLRQLLAPYEDRLEWATIYGIPTLRRPGAKGHEWFAFVKPATKFVSFYLLPVHEHAALRSSLSPALARKLTGRSTFNFGAVDEELFAELEGVIARAFDLYMAETEATSEGDADKASSRA
jgi:hypothetical protein